MKKISLFFFSLLCFMAFAISYAVAESGIAFVLEMSDREIKPENKLPECVEIIEDEAFEGTALIKIELSDNVISIGERAFACISSLREIRITNRTTYIASNAFEGNERTTITAPTNSYASAFAKNQGLPFSPIATLCASTSGTVVVLNNNTSHEAIDMDLSEIQEPERQWKKLEEIKVVGTLDIIYNSIQSRGPPMV